MRIRCAKQNVAETPSIVLIQQTSVPAFKVIKSDTSITVETDKMKVIFGRRDGALQFADPRGKTFLSEIPGTRILDSSTVQGTPTYIAEQAFLSPPGEHLFGSGEFQDGFLDVRDLPRRLTQVNSQIAIPFLLSSKGYGILWHNYGLTDLEPGATNAWISLERRPARRRRWTSRRAKARDEGSAARGRVCGRSGDSPQWTICLHVGHRTKDGTPVLR